ncbi:hypothetical protein I553_6635 [Mycobacterium xenopi 4042]|uniref:Uncharacterized protein n=1 Tax=Mycobacterium xenopi 4042 TaxID=1299334 RepID=X8BF92_MYCXE|nr:hypothetical protein I553_6635 [Mycobacterium xenopi 4042]
MRGTWFGVGNYPGRPSGEADTRAMVGVIGHGRHSSIPAAPAPTWSARVMPGRGLSSTAQKNRAALVW